MTGQLRFSLKGSKSNAIGRLNRGFALELRRCAGVRCGGRRVGRRRVTMRHHKCHCDPKGQPKPPVICPMRSPSPGICGSGSGSGSLIQSRKKPNKLCSGGCRLRRFPASARYQIEDREQRRLSDLLGHCCQSSCLLPRIDIEPRQRGQDTKTQPVRVLADRRKQEVVVTGTER